MNENPYTLSEEITYWLESNKLEKKVFAKMLSITASDLDKIMNGCVGFTPQIALKFQECTNVPAHVWQRLANQKDPIVKPEHSPYNGNNRNIYDLLGNKQIEELKDIAENHRLELSRKKAEVLLDIASGKRIVDIARAHCIERHTINSWIKSFKKNGMRGVAKERTAGDAEYGQKEIADEQAICNWQ